MKDEEQIRFLEIGTRLAFGAIALVLTLFAIVMIAYGVGETAYALLYWQAFDQAVLKGVGYIVVSIAVFEVAKYLVEEEVMRSRKLRTTGEARRSLTKFISTVSIAVFLEGLVTVFRVSNTSVPDLVYPAVILITAILLILGLGAYQRLSVGVERQVEQTDRRAAGLKR